VGNIARFLQTGRLEDLPLDVVQALIDVQRQYEQVGPTSAKDADRD
jgi:hypothetical protein